MASGDPFFNFISFFHFEFPGAARIQRRKQDLGGGGPKENYRDLFLWQFLFISLPFPIHNTIESYHRGGAIVSSPSLVCWRYALYSFSFNDDLADWIGWITRCPPFFSFACFCGGGKGLNFISSLTWKNYSFIKDFSLNKFLFYLYIISSSFYLIFFPLSG